MIAQGLQAAQRSVDDDKVAHSLHAYFMRPGDEDFPIIYRIVRDRDGTSCDLEFTHALRDFLRGLGYRVAINNPYRGVELVRAARRLDPDRGPRRQRHGQLVDRGHEGGLIRGVTVLGDHIGELQRVSRVPFRRLSEVGQDGPIELDLARVLLDRCGERGQRVRDDGDARVGLPQRRAGEHEPLDGRSGGRCFAANAVRALPR